MFEKSEEKSKQLADTFTNPNVDQVKPDLLTPKSDAAPSP